MKALLKIMICCYSFGAGAMELSKSPASDKPSQEDLAKYLLRQVYASTDPKHLNPAIHRCEKYVQRYPKGPVFAAAYVLLGDLYCRFPGKDKQAKKSYLKAWEHVEALADARARAANQLGYFCILACEYKQAQRYFEYAKQLIEAAYYPKVLNGLGVAYFCDKKLELARRCWDEILQLHNERYKARASYNLSILCEEQGKFKEALSFLRLAKQCKHPFGHGVYVGWESSLISKLKSHASE